MFKDLLGPVTRVKKKKKKHWGAVLEGGGNTLDRFNSFHLEM